MKYISEFPEWMVGVCPVEKWGIYRI